MGARDDREHRATGPGVPPWYHLVTLWGRVFPDQGRRLAAKRALSSRREGRSGRGKSSATAASRRRRGRFLASSSTRVAVRPPTAMVMAQKARHTDPARRSPVAWTDMAGRMSRLPPGWLRIASRSGAKRYGGRCRGSIRHRRPATGCVSSWSTPVDPVSFRSDSRETLDYLAPPIT